LVVKSRAISVGCSGGVYSLGKNTNAKPLVDTKRSSPPASNGIGFATERGH